MKLQFWNQYLYIRRQSRRKAENDNFETDNFNWNIFGLCIGIGRRKYRTSAKEAAIKNGDVAGYIEKRWKDQREYFSNKSAKMQSTYQRMQIWIIVLSAISAAVLAINFDEVFGTIKMEGEEKAIITDKWFNNRIVCALLTMLVVVLTSIDKFMQYREEWIKNRKASERLKREYCLYRLGAGEYENTEKKAKNTDNDDSKDGGKDDDKDDGKDDGSGAESSESPKPQPPTSPSSSSFAFANVTIENKPNESYITPLVPLYDCRTVYEKEMEDLKSKHQKELNDMKAAHQKEMDDEKANSKSQIEDLNKQHEDEINELKEKFREETESIKNEEIERRVGFLNLLVAKLNIIVEDAESNQDFLDIVDEVRNFKEKAKNNCEDSFKILFDEINELDVFADSYKEFLDKYCDEILKDQTEFANIYKEKFNVVLNDIEKQIKTDRSFENIKRICEQYNNEDAEDLNNLFEKYQKKLIDFANTNKNLLGDIRNNITTNKENADKCVQENCQKMFKKIDKLVDASHLDKKLVEKISKEISAFQNGEGDYKMILHLNSDNVYYKTGLFLSRIRRINKEADGFLYELQEAIAQEIKNFETMEGYFAISDRTVYFLQRVNEIAVQHKNGPGRYKCYRRLTEEISNYVRFDGEYSSFEKEELSSQEKKLVDKLSFIAENDKFWLSRHFYYRDIQAVIIDFKLKKGDFAEKNHDDNSKYKVDYRDLVFVNNTEGIVAEDVDDFIARKIALANFEEQLDKLIEKKLGGFKGKADESKTS